MNLTRQSVLVYDGSGLYGHIAETLAAAFGRTLYYTPWTSQGFPTSKRRMVGLGLPKITRVYSWLEHLNDVDLVVFPDCYNWDECQFARDAGKPVWGSGRAECLETERWRTRELMAEMGMPVVPAELVIGTDALRAHLADKEDLYIKCSVTRGDFETRHHVNAEVTEPWLTDLEQKLGPLKDDFEFIVEESMSGVEIGYDGYFIDGLYPPVAMMGYEIKDKGYVGKVIALEEWPKLMADVNGAFAPAMKALGMRGFFSNEIRVADDGTPYLIDPTMRAGRPPSECYMEAFTNWPEVIYRGARGEVVELSPICKYAAEVILKSDWVRTHYLAVSYPPSIAQWIKLANCAEVDGKRTIVPQDDPEFGSAIGLGETLDEACAMAVANAEKVEALDLDYRHDVFDAAQEEIEKGAKHGIEF